MRLLSIFYPKSIVSFDFTSLVNAFGLNGQGLDAFDLFQQIPDHLRNEISYVCVLNSCSHAGLLNQARMIFERVKIKTNQITTTMVHLLLRSLDLLLKLQLFCFVLDRLS